MKALLLHKPLEYLSHVKLVIFDVLMISVLSLTLHHTSDIMGSIEGVEWLGWAAAIVIECGIIASAYISLDRSEVISRYRFVPIILTGILIIVGDGFNTNYYMRHPVSAYGLWELDSKQVAWILGAFLPVTACFMGVIRGILHQVYYPIKQVQTQVVEPVKKPKPVVQQGVVVTQVEVEKQPDNVVNFGKPQQPQDAKDVYEQYRQDMITLKQVEEMGFNPNSAKSYKARQNKKEKERA